MRRTRVDYTGQRYGKLVAIERVGANIYRQPIWTFECDCGNRKDMVVNHVTDGGIRSCGCLPRGKRGGKTSTPIGD